MARNFKRRFFLSLLWGKVFLLTLLAVLLPDHFASAAPLQSAKKVLLLYSYQAVLPGNLKWDEGIRTALKGTPSERIEFYTEYLDLAQFPEESYLQNLLNLLRNKYASRKMDLLIPVRDPAFQFLLAHGNSIFPGVPIVFCAAEINQVQPPKRLENTTGVTFWIDIAGTLAAALKLHPQIRQVALVGGTAKSDRRFQQVAREALRQYEGQIKVISLIDLPFTEILQRVAKLPPHTIVLYLCIFRDSAGNEFIPQDALVPVAQAANAPVYGLWKTLLGHGIVGGHLMSFTEQGRLAGELGRRVLNGEKPENIPIIYGGADVYEFDWRQLKRWGLKESDLPPGSLVRFRQQSLWENHKREVIGTAAVFSVLSLLVVSLLINLSRRRRAERALAKRLQFETLLAELSGQFVAVEAKEVDREIDQGIKQLVEFLGIDRGRLWQLSGPEGEFLPIHSWAVPEIQAISPPPTQERFPWIRSQMLHGIPVAFSRPDELPEGAKVDRQSLLADGIKSALCIPLSVGGKFIGALTLSTLRAPKVWPPGLAQELRPIGEIFANALIRGVADNELRQGELKYRIVADFTYDWEYWQNPDGTWRYVSPACERISGHRPEEFLRRPGLLRDLIVPEDRDRWDHHCNSWKNPSGQEFQFRIRRPDGSIRCIEHACRPVTDDAGKFIGIRASNRDITERRQAEISEQQHREQLAHVTRVATLGELTASLAHEVNQPLNAVMNNAQAALRFLHRENPDMKEVDGALGDIVRDGKRASEVIQRLRQFLRPGEMRVQEVDINQVIEETAALTRNEFQTSNTNIRFSLADNLPPVCADRIQIQQVVLNLLMNAKEAMDHSGTNPREILVQTRQGDAETVQVSVRDRGAGLPSEDLEKIFEPFHTTKTAGMGLGLAISRSIIASLGGKVWAAPNPDQGTTLAFTLPIFKEDFR